MSLIPSPVLIIGDTKLGKDTVVKAKKKYSNFYWETVSASEQTPDEIRMISCFQQFGISNKIVLITDLPNRKQVRDFILELVKSANENLRFVIWDSKGSIKIDPKKGINKTWQSWIDSLKKNEKFVLVNNGGDFAENDYLNSVKYVQQLFAKRNRSIDNVSAKIFVDLVGKNRAMLSSEISKMSLTAPKVVTRDYILNNTFPSSKEAVLYKFGNDLDKNYQSAISSLEMFLSLGVNANVLAQIMINKARWHLVLCDLYSKGLDLTSIRNEMLGMGRFPSCVWHNDQLPALKKKSLSIKLNDPKNLEEFMTRKLGIPSDYLKIEKPKTISKAVKRGEVIPMPFIADMMINHFKNSILLPNRNKYSGQEQKDKILNRAVNVYLSLSDGLKEIRYSTETQKENLYSMVRIWSNNLI
jgi:hypothetical protein